MPLLPRVLKVLFLIVVGSFAVCAAAERGLEDLQKEVLRLETIEPFNLDREIAVLVDDATLAEVVHLHRILGEGRASVASGRIYLRLFLRWGKLDGPAALRAASNDPSASRARYEGEAAAGWAHYDPRRAWQEIVAVSQGRAAAGSGSSSALYVIAERDLELALTFYQELPPSRSCLECNAGNICIAAIRMGKFDVIFAALDRMRPGPARNALRDRYWTLLGEVLEGNAMDWLTRMTTKEDRDAAEIKAYMGWAAVKADVALDHVLRIQDTAQFENTLLAVVQVWGRRARTEDVKRLLSRLPKDLSERSTLGLASHLAGVDAAATLPWVQAFVSSSVRNEALARVVRVWAQLEPDAARDYFRRIEDLDLRGVLVANYLLSKLQNKTLQAKDLEEIIVTFDKEWSKRLLRQIGTNLMNPKINDTQFFDIEGLVAFVNARPEWTEPDRAFVLGAVGR